MWFEKKKKDPWGTSFITCFYTSPFFNVPAVTAVVMVKHYTSLLQELFLRHFPEKRTVLVSSRVLRWQVSGEEEAIHRCLTIVYQLPVDTVYT